MTLCWLTVTFTQFLFFFLVKYLPGGVYINQTYRVISEMAGSACGGIFFRKLGVKRSLAFAFFLSLIGGIGMCLYCFFTGYYTETPSNSAIWLFQATLLFGVFGFSSA